MGIKELFHFGRARDKPSDYYSGTDYRFLFGPTTSGKNVNEFRSGEYRRQADHRKRQCHPHCGHFLLSVQRGNQHSGEYGSDWTAGAAEAPGCSGAIERLRRQGGQIT